MPYLSIRKSEFFPLTLTMGLENILFGTMTLGDRWQGEIKMFPKLSDKWIEVTVLPNETLIQAIQSLDDDQVLKKGDTVLAVHISGQPSREGKDKSPSPMLHKLQEVPYDGPLEIITSLQYLIDHNATRIIQDADAGLASGSGGRHEKFPHSFIDPRTEIQRIIIDDRQGPVVIKKNATILPGAKIMGPISILPGVVVKMGAELYPGSTFGNHAVINGEIKNSIIHEHSAKGHAGYLGDSILGRWNNLGAGTTVSNVSNTFSKVRFRDWNTDKEVTYDTVKRGLVTGDFVKLGILSKIYRATAIGSFSSIATAQSIQGNISPLTWWSDDKISKYGLDQLRDHCRKQMKLHGHQWSGDWEEVLSGLIKNHFGNQIKIRK